MEWKKIDGILLQFFPLFLSFFIERERLKREEMIRAEKEEAFGGMDGGGMREGGRKTL